MYFYRKTVCCLDLDFYPRSPALDSSLCCSLVNSPEAAQIGEGWSGFGVRGWNHFPSPLFLFSLSCRFKLIIYFSTHVHDTQLKRYQRSLRNIWKVILLPDHQSLSYFSWREPLLSFCCCSYQKKSVNMRCMLCICKTNVTCDTQMRCTFVFISGISSILEHRGQPLFFFCMQLF